MTTIADLQKSVSDMTDDELREHLLAVRQRRREPTKPKKSSTPRKVVNPLKGVDPEMAKLLLEALGESPDD